MTALALLLTSIFAAGAPLAVTIPRIVSPADGTVVEPGQTILVVVRADPRSAVVAVIGEELLGGCVKVGSSADTYHCSLEIPKWSDGGEHPLYPLAGDGVSDAVGGFPITLVVKKAVKKP